ncbi:MAG: FAD-dependent oxidoreductase [Rhodospirillaceae bacterium]|nr:FAD-dependent oxidoreductase [Rhodospirillaceae bacterium]
MKVAIIGSGISGNMVAYQLNKKHDLTIFEANDYVGGHVNTIDVIENDSIIPVDTGFIVFNDQTYNKFSTLLRKLNVCSQPSDMSFSVSCKDSGLEYNGTNINKFFCQRRNIFRPYFHRMIYDIFRFNRLASRALEDTDENVLLSDYLLEKQFSQQFINKYLLPMCSAIWSADLQTISKTPLKFIVRFMENHGLLSINNRPLWKVIKGGSKVYLKQMVSDYSSKIKLSTPIQWVKRYPSYVELKPVGGVPERFDQVFIACHSDQALRLLSDPSTLEKEILGAIDYQFNHAILHTDDSILPKQKMAWAAWNYFIPEAYEEPAFVTYNMNILQNLKSKKTYCVTLNGANRIQPNKIIKKISYHHPTFTHASISAQKRRKEINGVNRTYFCGAYWGNDFHEDGVLSAIAAVEDFEG